MNRFQLSSREASLNGCLDRISLFSAVLEKSLSDFLCNANSCSNNLVPKSEVPNFLWACGVSLIIGFAVDSVEVTLDTKCNWGFEEKEKDGKEDKPPSWENKFQKVSWFIEINKRKKKARKRKKECLTHFPNELPKRKAAAFLLCLLWTCEKEES